jgi:hypothetical protein
MLAVDIATLTAVFDDLYAIVNPPLPLQLHIDGKLKQVERDKLVRRLELMRKYFQLWKESILEQEREGKPKQYAFDNLQHDVKNMYNKVEWYFKLIDAWLKVQE